MLPGSIQPVGCLRVDLHLARGRGHPLARPCTVDSLCRVVKFANSHKALFRVVKALLDDSLLRIKYTLDRDEG